MWPMAARAKRSRETNVITFHRFTTDREAAVRLAACVKCRLSAIATSWLTVDVVVIPHTVCLLGRPAGIVVLPATAEEFAFQIFLKCTGVDRRYSRIDRAIPLHQPERGCRAG